ncbi:hypothetical protein SAMN04488032_11665 [Pacificibacter marinus]|uniref:Uncharacterized protein n=1 Tax=Pacificibacter marinus TaxID=658057 RepID=A0A1Y5TP08_9RHOB|nr:hypothetical protein SAMN04488032_11665 [Pacificibacter marinus]SLN66596.1 hypothetical protein PAM7971_03504 [Pacificibacter marinus]
MAKTEFENGFREDTGPARFAGVAASPLALGVASDGNHQPDLRVSDRTRDHGAQRPVRSPKLPLVELDPMTVLEIS